MNSPNALSKLTLQIDTWCQLPNGLCWDEFLGACQVSFSSLSGVFQQFFKRSSKMTSINKSPPNELSKLRPGINCHPKLSEFIGVIQEPVRILKYFGL